MPCANPHGRSLCCQRRNDPSDIAIRKVAVAMKPEFIKLVEGGEFAPVYAKLVSSTPQDLLDKTSH